MTEREQVARTIESLQTRYRLARYPETQAEAIAYHYASMATTAFTLKKLVEQKQYGVSAPDIGEMIDMLIVDVKEAHFKAFGLELEWKEKT
jgi:Asp/Glu/hydantoin racemase